MKIQLDTHEGLIIENPTIEILEGTKDFHLQEKFQPSVRLHLADNKSKIFHQCPMFPYSPNIENGWDDAYVKECIDKYFEEMDRAQNQPWYLGGGNWNPLNWFKS